MKQLLFMIAMTGVGTLGAFVNPFYSVAVYYLFAVLRPQYMWQWSLPPGIQWSFYVGVVALFAALLRFLGVRAAPPRTGGDDSDELTGWGAPHMWLLAFGVWLCITTVTALNRDVAWHWGQEYLKILTMFLVGSALISTVRHVWTLLLITATVLGYIAYEINYLYFVNGFLGIQRNGYGGLDNNGAGLMLAMGVPLCLYVWMATGRWWRWFYLALVPALIHAVLMTYSRGAMMSLIAVVPLLVLRSRRRLEIGSAVMALLLLLPLLAGNEIRARFFSIEQYDKDGSAQSRFASWAAAWKIAQDYPVLGVGVRNSTLVSMDYGADQEGRAIHSQYLQLLADNGFPGLITYLGLLWAVWQSLRRVRRAAGLGITERHRMLGAMAGGLETSLAVFCVGAMFLSLEVFELPYLICLLAAQLGRLRLDADSLVDMKPDRSRTVQARTIP